MMPTEVTIINNSELRESFLKLYLSKNPKKAQDENSSKSVSEQEQLANKRFYKTEEIPESELPMQYGTTHNMEIGDMESKRIRWEDTNIKLLGNPASLLESPDEIRGCVIAFLEIMKLGQLQQALWGNEELFRTVFEESPIGIVVVDSDSKIVKVNRVLCQMLNYTELELSQVTLIEKTHPTDVEKEEKLFEQLFKGETKGFKLEKKLLKKSGEIIWVSLTTAAIRDSKGKVSYGLGMIENISDRKQIETERDQLLERERMAREQAESANRSKDEFLAMVSHELRSPLNAIVGWTQLLRKKKYNERTAEQALEIIERNARSQSELIDDLLDISQIVRGQIRLKVASVNLAAIIKEAMDVVLPLAEMKNIAIAAKICPESAWVAGDFNRLQQVIWNLLSNAIKFTPEAGKIEIELSIISDPTGYAQIQVCDSGKGINPEFLPYVFDRYRQADPHSSKPQKGLGLGLAIVRQLVELHQGTVKAESPGLGQGATFTVKLPLTDEPC